jgi:hypothetical protein
VLTALWRKAELLIEAMAEGYDQIAWLDTDCVIVDSSVVFLSQVALALLYASALIVYE